MNLDTPAGEAMIEAGAQQLRGERARSRRVLSASLSATVECAACGGSGRISYDGPGERLCPDCPHRCLLCEGTGQRLAIREALDE